MNRRDFLTEATAEEAQLALSYLVWPKQAPDPRLVDEWVRCQIRRDPGTAPGQHAASISGIAGTPDPHS
jgi:hypothetical protein